MDKVRKMSTLQKNIYQGRNPTAHYSQQIMLQALNELLKTKPFKSISVSEICQRSGVSRQTFYTLFGSKENILLYQLEQANKTKPADDDVEILTLSEICKRYAGFVIDNHTMLQELLDNDLVAILNAQFYQAMSVCQNSFVNVTPQEQRYVAEFMSAGLCHLTNNYLSQHSEPNKAELASLAYKIMSGSVYRIQ